MVPTRPAVHGGGSTPALLTELTPLLVLMMAVSAVQQFLQIAIKKWGSFFSISPLSRYVRILGNVVHAIQIKTKLCQLVEVMMERRDDLSFCQEMKFRSVQITFF